MFRTQVFIFTFLMFFQVFPYPECMNEEKITEQCIKDVHKSGDLDLVAEHIDKSVFKNSSEMLTLKADSLYRTGRYDELEKVINALNPGLKSSLYFRVMLLRSMLARQRLNQTLEMLDSIKDNFPVYYQSSGLDCIRGDIQLYKKQYESALATYDSCTSRKDSVFASYNRIVTLEKNGPPKNSLLEDYISFAEKYEGSAMTSQIVDRFVKMRERDAFPGAASPYYSRWLAIMRKSGALDRFFTDDFLKVSTFPAFFEIVRYLTSKNRYNDALTMVERELSGKNSDIERRFQLINEKYKLLVLLNRPAEASEFMLISAMDLPEDKKDRLEFFAGLNYFDTGYIDEGRAVLESIVYEDRESKFFLMALYKLGLIYLSEGSQLYTFTLWSNYIFDTTFSASRYHGGQRLLTDIMEIASLIDRINNFCTLSSDPDFECATDEQCIPETGTQIISYYDFAYFSLINRDEFKIKPAHSSDRSYIEKWKKNRMELTVDERAVLEKMVALPKKIRNNEYVSMIEHFLNSGVRDGALFYLDAIGMVFRYDGPDAGDKESTDAVKAELLEFKSRMNGTIIRYLGRTGDIADSNYNAVSQSLTYSPHYGKADEWRSIYPAPYFDDIMKLSVEFEIPPQLIYSIMRAETFYRDNLVSPVGALGLMQVMPDTFEKIKKYGGIKIKDPFNPYESMKASAWYLSKLVKRFDGSYIAAIAAYNAGPHRVTEWIKKYKGMDNYLFVEMIPYQETRNYVKKVLRYFEIYSYLYEGTFYDVGLNGVVDIEEQPDIVNF